MLALTSPTSGGCSVGMARLQTQATLLESQFQYVPPICNIPIFKPLFETLML
jgi:hypothetical protein